MPRLLAVLSAAVLIGGCASKSGSPKSARGAAVALAESLNNRALLYYSQDKYAQAEPFYKRSLAIWEKALGPDHPNVAQSLENIAALYRATNRKQEAEKLEQRAARIRAATGTRPP